MHRSLLFSRSSGRPTHAPFESALVNEGPNFDTTFARQSLSAVASGLDAFFERQLNLPCSFLAAAFTFELAHLKSGSVAAVARCGAVTISPQSSIGDTSAFLIVVVPFLLWPSIAHVGDELVLAVHLGDGADFHLLGRVPASVIDREHQLLVGGVVAVPFDAVPIFDGRHLQRLAAEVVQQVRFNVDALAVQDAPEVVPRRLVVRRPRLSLAHASGHDVVRVLLPFAPQLSQELLTLRLEGVTKLVEQAVDRRLRVGQTVLARCRARGRPAGRGTTGRDCQQSECKRQCEPSHGRSLSRTEGPGRHSRAPRPIHQSLTSYGS